MAMLLKASGGFEVVTPANGGAFTLAQLQAFVGGYIETAPAPGGLYLVINEDGKRLNLPRNPEATFLYHLAGGILDDVVVGDVLLATVDEIGG